MDFAIDVITQLGECLVRVLCLHPNPIGLHTLDRARACAQEAIGPTVGRMALDETNLPLNQLLTEEHAVDDIDPSRHRGDDHRFQSGPDAFLDLVGVTIPVNDLLLKAVAASAYTITENSGTPSDAGGVDELVEHRDWSHSWRSYAARRLERPRAAIPEDCRLYPDCPSRI